ncbi:MAG: YaiI/YqxD family protein [Gammaproteobacteria bacterium]|nr:YaiI/YqxD family protein [Gammaproteobacteria bacterium]
MQIWVDADACPRAIKEILYRAAERVGMQLILVANQPLQVPGSRFIRTVQVSAGFDVADNYIVQAVDEGDLVITADIPLAAEVIANGARALNPRGELYTQDNIRERLNMRDFMDTLRGSGVDTGGPAAFSNAERMAFANRLDRLLASLAQQGMKGRESPG